MKAREMKKICVMAGLAASICALTACSQASENEQKKVTSAKVSAVQNTEYGAEHEIERGTEHDLASETVHETVHDLASETVHETVHETERELASGTAHETERELASGTAHETERGVASEAEYETERELETATVTETEANAKQEKAAYLAQEETEQTETPLQTVSKEVEERVDIDAELAGLEAEAEILNAQLRSGELTQIALNTTSAEVYKLWDEELNSIWSRLKEKLDAKTMEELTEKQRAWILDKEEQVAAEGEEYGNGSMRPLIENDKAAELTREKVYELAEWLR